MARPPTAGAAPLRLAEVLAALSLATDLANGNPPETALRTALLAVGLARATDASPADTSAALYAALLRFVGCTSFAHEEAAAFDGDDIALRQLYAPIDLANTGEAVWATLSRAAAGRGSLARARAVARLLAGAGRLRAGLWATQCEVARRFASRMNLGDAVTLALGQIHERWDATGAPAGLSGEALSVAARLVHVAHAAAWHHQQGGRDAALDVARARRGRQLEPRLVDALVADGPALLAPLEAPSVWDALLAHEAARTRPPLSHDDLDRVAEAFADFADLASVHTLGHSPGVASLAARAGEALGLDADAVTALRRASLLHDLGHVSVPAGVWEKPGALSAAEWERARLHPYYTERVLARSPALAPLGAIASRHHERLDGGGYFRGLDGGALALPARVLAAADTYPALLEPRPHRAARAPADAARVLGDEAREGRLDARAVGAVLEAAGHPRQRVGRAWPAGLSDREVEVLRLVARGRSNKEIAQVLAISSRTVQHHVIHAYAKTGVSTRAAAALFVVEHDLLEPQ